ncbi:uncharacterized protein [Procambarus clarkii]|uniref:uncharacterized protein n=1 Tax=Procambarus clarkii TaxID=6728 RepID=UPI003744968A
MRVRCSGAETSDILDKMDNNLSNSKNKLLSASRLERMILARVQTSWNKTLVGLQTARDQKSVSDHEQEEDGMQQHKDSSSRTITGVSRNTSNSSSGRKTSSSSNSSSGCTTSSSSNSSSGRTTSSSSNSSSGRTTSSSSGPRTSSSSDRRTSSSSGPRTSSSSGPRTSSSSGPMTSSSSGRRTSSSSKTCSAAVTAGPTVLGGPKMHQE